MLRVVLVLALVGFTVYTLVDCLQAPEDGVRSLPKGAWAVLIVLFTPAGGLGWWLAGRPQSPPLPGGTGRTGPRGPDDDPDFLRSL